MGEVRPIRFETSEGSDVFDDATEVAIGDLLEDVEMAARVSAEETFISGVTSANPLAVRSVKERELDRLQSAGEPISNLSFIKRYGKTKTFFLVREAQLGDEFALEQLCRNGARMAIAQTEKFIRFSVETRGLFREMPLDPDDITQAVIEDVPKIVERYDPSGGLPFNKMQFHRIGFTIIDRLRLESVSQGVGRARLESLKTALASSDSNQALHHLVIDGFVEAPQYVVDGQISLGSISLDALLDEQLNEQRDVDDNEIIDSDLVRSELVDRDADPAQIIIGNADTANLDNCVNSLPERERAVVVRHFGLFGVEPQTFLEIANESGVTESRIAQIHSRALEHLAQLMQGEVINVRERQRARLANMPHGLSKRRLIQEAQQRLGGRPDLLMLNHDIENAARIVSDWSATNSYEGVTKITRFKRELPDGFDTDLLLSDFPQSERWHVKVRAGDIIIYVTDIQAKDLGLIMQAELTLMENVHVVENDDVIEAVTSTQEYVLRHLYETMSQIAAGLGVEASTARTHVHNICKLFGLSSFIDLAVFSARSGLIDLDSLPFDSSTDNLSKREREILRNHYNHTYAEAAEALGLSISTVRTHWSGIFKELKVFNRAQAALIAMRDGLIAVAPTEELAESA